MRRKNLLRFQALAAFCLACAVSFAQEAPTVNPYLDVLKSVPRPEMAPQAATIVAQTEPAEQETVTVAVVQAASAISPAAAPTVVGAIAGKVPTMAALAAATAAVEQPKFAPAIAKAAASAAPDYAAAIVGAICRKLPEQYYVVATTVARTAPAASADILVAVSAALPALKPYVDQAIAAATTGSTSVSAILTDAARLAGTAMPDLHARGQWIAGPQPPPRPGPPFAPLPSKPRELTPDNSGQIPQGSRNYARP